MFTFLKQWGLLYMPVASGDNFPVPSTLQLSRTVTLCFDFVPPWQESPLYVSVLLGWRLYQSSVSSILNMSFSW